MNNTDTVRKERLANDFPLERMDRQELETLSVRVSRELDGRAFEQNLRRELDAHNRRQRRGARPGGQDSDRH